MWLRPPLPTTSSSSARPPKMPVARFCAIRGFSSGPIAATGLVCRVRNSYQLSVSVIRSAPSSSPSMAPRTGDAGSDRQDAGPAPWGARPPGRNMDHRSRCYGMRAANNQYPPKVCRRELMNMRGTTGSTTDADSRCQYRSASGRSASRDRCRSRRVPLQSPMSIGVEAFPAIRGEPARGERIAAPTSDTVSPRIARPPTPRIDAIRCIFLQCDRRGAST
jgi:hypothetical protein